MYCVYIVYVVSCSCCIYVVILYGCVYICILVRMFVLQYERTALAEYCDYKSIYQSISDVMYNNDAISYMCE